MTAEPNFGETPGGLQTPHATKVGDEYLMVYGDWENICLARGQDGKTFARQLGADGRSGMFNEDWENSTRDAMLLAIGDTYYVYYTAKPGPHRRRLLPHVKGPANLERPRDRFVRRQRW